MNRYRVTRESLGPWPVVAMADAVTGTGVRVAQRGATLLDYRVPVAGRLCSLVDAYASAGELATRHGSRFAIMLPFANRIAEARYHFVGKDYDLQPGAASQRSIMHGFVRDADFEVISTAADDACGCVRLRAAIAPEVHPGYPFALDLEVAFTLHAGGLDLEATMRNVGTAAAPCFFGWHPYLRLRADGVDGCELKLPARQTIVTDQAQIPLPGTAAFKPLDACPELDFREWRRIAGSVLDHGFAGRITDLDGRLRTHLRDPDTGLAVAMWQARGVTQVYTSDTLDGPAVRRSVALEPMEAMTDAFNRPDCVDAITLQAGAERHFRCGLEVQSSA